MSATLDPLIQQKLSAFAQRRRKLIIIKGALAAVAALLLTMLAVALVDLKWMLPDWLRWSLSGAAYLAVLVVVWRACLRQLLHAPDERQIARLVEHAEPGLREDLLSAVELGRTPGEVFDSEQFRALLQADVARRMGGVEMKALLPVALIRRTIGWAAAIALIVVAMMFASGWRFHTLLLRALFPGANLERVSRTKVNVQEPEGGDRIVPQGDTVRVVVELTGEPSNRARIETMGDTGGWQVMNMEPLGNNRFAATVQVSRASVRYRIKAGDALTRKYLLDARERPYVTEYAKTFHFPKYSELADRSVAEKDGALVALEGTEVELKLKTNQPVKRAELLIEQGKTSSTVALVAGMDGLLAGKITMNASGSYRVHLTGAETGFENKFSPENEIRAEADLLPAVELEKPKNDLILPANELVDIAGNATDDLGLAKVSRLVKINSGGWKETVLAQKPGKQTRIDDKWDLFQAGVKPGDLLTMKLVATDLKGSKAESRPLQVTITASGFEMRRVQALDSLRAMNESVRALAEQASQLHSAVRKANESTAYSRAADEAAVKQAGMATGGAVKEFDVKFTEAWTALGGALRDAKGGHLTAELVMLGRELARTGFGTARNTRAEAEAILVSPAARKVQASALESSAEVSRRAKSAESLAEAITLSEEAAVLAENGLILVREQKRLMEMTSNATKDDAQWASLLSRLKVTASQTKVIEDILAPMSTHAGPGKERAKILALQLQRHREGLMKTLPDSRDVKNPTMQIAMMKLGEFNRGIENSARGFNDWSREFGLRPVALMRDAAQETGPVYGAVTKLADSLEPIRKEQTFSEQARALLTTARWKICSELFKTNGDLEEIRHRADNQFVSDVRQAVVALDALHAVAPGTDAAEIHGKLDELDAVFRVLESGHNLQEAMEGFTQLASSERWEIRDLAARTDATRDWRWLEARMRTIPDELGRAKPAKAEQDLAKVFGDAQGILWKAQQLEAWRSMEREMGGRANFDYVPMTARKDAEQLAGQVKLALDLFRKPMDEARKKLAKLSPTVSQLASALAKEQAEVKKETEKRAANEEKKNPEDAKTEAEKQIAQQQQLNQKVETLKDLVRADANKQDILNKDQREKMRDADDALAMLKDPPPKAEQALQDAAASTPEQQKADLTRATEQQQKLADALTQIAEHFEKMEQGKPADETRTALREAEKELGIKEQLDAQQAHAQMLAEMAQKDPQQLLKELEAKLPENPAMQKELSAISKDTLADAGQKLDNAAKQEGKVAQEVGDQAKQEQAKTDSAQKNAADAAKQAAQAAQKAAETAQQEAKTAGNPQAEQQAGKAATEAAAAAQNAQQAAQAAEQMAKANSPAETAKAAQQAANKAGEAAKAAEQAAGDAKQAQATAQQAAAKGGDKQPNNEKSSAQSAEAAQQAEKAAQAAKQAQNLAQAAANEAAAMAQAAKLNTPNSPTSANNPQQAANSAAQAAKQAAQAAQAAQKAAQTAQQQANNAANLQAAQQAAKAANEAGAAAQDAQQAAQAAEKAAATGDAQQAAQAAQQAANKAGDAAKAADMAANDAQGAQANAQQAAAKGGDQQPANQQAAQESGEAAKQAQAAAQAARQAQAAALQAAQEAGAMAQQNPQLAKAAQQQQPIAANAADAGAEVARAGRHEQRLGNQPAGEQLAQLGEQITGTAEKTVPEAQKALNNAKSAAAAAAPVNEAKAQLAAELSALNNQANGQTAQPASSAAQPAPQGAQANAQSAAQPAGQQAAQSSGQPAGQQAAQPSSQPAGQQAAAAASPTEQQAMARALDALDQQLNPSAAQQAANAEGQQGQQGQQQGKEGQQGQQGQQQGQQQAQGNQPGQQQGNQPGQPGQPGQQGQQQSPSQSAMAQAAQAAQASMRMDRAQNSATQPGSLLGASQSDKSLGGAKAEGTALNSKDLPNANDLKRGDWGKLPKKLAEQLTKGSQESIPGEYRQAVETYYRVIAEKTKKRP